MKIKITFKDPDGVSNSIIDYVASQVESIAGLDDDEKETLSEQKTEKVNEALEPWIKYGECLEVEIDTDKGTATVLPAR